MSRDNTREIEIPTDFPASLGVVGRRVVITGASRGLGRVVATAFARSGATVGLVARDRERLSRVARELPGDHHRTFVGDIRDEGFNREVASGMCEQFGGLDAWISNAGISPVRDQVSELQESRWRDVMDTNVSGAFYGAKAAQDVLQPGGRIIFTSSVIGQRSLAGLAAYGASKAAIESLVRTLAIEVGPRGVTVNAVALGWFDSPLAAPIRADGDMDQAIVNHTALRRWGNASDLPGIFLFLVSDAAQFITGAVIPVDGGYLLT